MGEEGRGLSSTDVAQIREGKGYPQMTQIRKE
jgi:hypothetical protein